jgi:hypothetical protein
MLIERKLNGSIRRYGDVKGSNKKEIRKCKCE